MTQFWMVRDGLAVTSVEREARRIRNHETRQGGDVQVKITHADGAVCLDVADRRTARVELMNASTF
jgi:hypothetical protein